MIRIIIIIIIIMTQDAAEYQSHFKLSSLWGKRTGNGSSVFLIFLIRSITLMSRTSAHGVFAVETFLKTGESVIPTQSVFRAHFRLYQNYAVPDEKSSLLCLESLLGTESF